MISSESVKNEKFMLQNYDAEINHLKSRIVTSNDNLNLRLQFATSKKWDTLRSQNATMEARLEKHRKYLPYAFTSNQLIEKSQQSVAQLTQIPCDSFNTLFAQQVVSQLVQIPWRQNITKDLPDEFRSSLPSIEEIEAELSGVEDEIG